MGDTNRSGTLEAQEFSAALAASHNVVKAAVAVALAPTLGLANGVSHLVSTEGGDAPEVPDMDALMGLVGELPLPAPEDFGKSFRQLDTNRDGRLSLEEVAAALDKPHVQKWLLPQLA